MKKIFTLYLCLCLVIFARSQAVLNEVYPQPGNGYNEFFELYNENSTVESLDNYTLVAYYEESTKTGFYVFDLPNYNLIPHGYYVAASANPYNIQGQLNLTPNTDWNALAGTTLISKWERNGGTYTLVPVPFPLNDLFVKITGAGGVFHIFLFKNGIIVNGLVAGLNTTVVPAYIKTMPNLPVDMTGTSPDFTINFNAIPDNSIEYLSNSAGTNNGYYRSADGFCGAWLKSDQPGQHTPGVTNGTSPNLTSQISIAATVTQYSGDPTKALLTYNITGAPLGALPVTVEVYIDNGVSGQFDLNDILIDSRIITSTSMGDQTIILPSWDTQVIILLKPASSCYNKTLAIGNFWSVLPVDLISFTGNMNRNNKVVLEWSVANNETSNLFEVERSIDGSEFKTAAVVFASEKTGKENYMFYETLNSGEKIMYRLKMMDDKNDITYSKVLVFQTTNVNKNTLKIIGNPVNDKLTFSYVSINTEIANVRIYDISGRTVLNNLISRSEGHNLASITLDPTFKPGMYVLEIKSGNEIMRSKFIKQ